MHQPTIEKLHVLRLGAMANALTAQLQQPEIDAMPFAERLGLLVSRSCSQTCYTCNMGYGPDNVNYGKKGRFRSSRWSCRHSRVRCRPADGF